MRANQRERQWRAEKRRRKKKYEKAGISKWLDAGLAHFLTSVVHDTTPSCGAGEYGIECFCLGLTAYGLHGKAKRSEQRKPVRLSLRTMKWCNGNGIKSWCEEFQACLFKDCNAMQPDELFNGKKPLVEVWFQLIRRWMWTKVVRTARQSSEGLILFF